jgi:hypothetical protein
MLLSRYRFLRWVPVYDDTPPDEDDPAPDDKEKKEKELNEKKFSQKDIDRAINARFKKERSENEKLLKQLEAIKTEGLTPDAKEELQSQIERLQESVQTKDQTLAQKIAELEKKHGKERDAVSGERDLWKNRYHQSRIERDMYDGANSAEAESAEQLVLMFGSSARLEEEVDAAGKGTGRFSTKVKFKGIDPETKKSVELDLPPGEAFAHMKEHGLHKNLFKHGAASGTGKPGAGSTGGKGGDTEPEPEKYASQEEYGKAYQEWRDGHDLSGAPIQKS